MFTKTFLLIALFSCTVLTNGCSSEKFLIKAEEHPVAPTARGLISAPESLLLVQNASLRLQPELYAEVKYRVDKNFHEFKEERKTDSVQMRLENISGIITQPVSFWVGELKIVATGTILVSFEAAPNSISIQGSGEVIWKRGKELIHADKIRIQDGNVEFIGKK